MSRATSSDIGPAPLAVTMGEPAGVGPELIARLWRDRKVLRLPPFVYVGSPDALFAVDADLPTVLLDSVHSATDQFNDSLPIVAVENAEQITPGTPTPANGACVVASIDKAVDLALSGDVSGIVTAPIHKAGLYQAGFNAPGHTEYLARLCGLNDSDSVMMLATDMLRVIPVTIHVALKDVAKNLTADAIIHAGMVAAHDLRTRFGVVKPRIALAGLNPHAGEGGTMGLEEATHLMPAVWALRDAGIEITDPQPADTLFHADARAKYDVALCMYHDQALIPIKTLDFWSGVNVTLGLPIIRTSPDHGTALPLAGTGTARTDSMLAAIRMATRMAHSEAQA
ncbi:4-hydroxythreonine-4-phosphate dehydrogenase PdxA [Kordiimonas aestuarii]|uniref:4-hydroxythreonine-4-phosphate dehydrogenase PdxA n=1 Tax=Kordiimonas aestuarii TaxID=1005925 RepID=UPI0021D2A354|nr:4-hydroxythreonine-4-phosphate dehydrogenase PdxA [Kordiimonas aestuarii]